MARVVTALLSALISGTVISAYGDDTCAGGFPEGSGNCAAQHSYSDYKEADKALNEAYKGLMKDLKGQIPEPNEEIKAIILLQRQWVQFRDAWCAQVKKNFTGGDQWGINWETECLTEMTKHRTEELRDYYRGG